MLAMHRNRSATVSAAGRLRFAPLKPAVLIAFNTRHAKNVLRSGTMEQLKQSVISSSVAMHSSVEHSHACGAEICPCCPASALCVPEVHSPFISTRCPSSSFEPSNFVTNAGHLLQKLYTKVSANLRTFHDPSRLWWQRRVAAADKAERAELALLESSLTLEEIAHFRAGVAAVHSRLLAVDHGVLQVSSAAH